MHIELQEFPTFSDLQLIQALLQTPLITTVDKNSHIFSLVNKAFFPHAI